MNIGASTLLADYAYRQAGGGSTGVSAALAALEASAKEVAGLVKKSGFGQSFDLLEFGASKAFGTKTYPLEKAAGKGPSLVQELINPPMGYGNPLLTPTTVLNPNVVGAFAAYQYGQAKKAGDLPAFQEAIRAETAKTFKEGLYDSAQPLPKERRAHAFSFFDPMDTNRDGYVSPMESLRYAQTNPAVDPKDRNLDGRVSPAEEWAYELAHPNHGLPRNSDSEFIDVFA